MGGGLRERAAFAFAAVGSAPEGLQAVENQMGLEEAAPVEIPIAEGAGEEETALSR